MSGRMSHPSRVRGLKRDGLECAYCGSNVAPLAGAWIETDPFGSLDYIRWKSHPSRVRGLKRASLSAFKASNSGRTPRGCVD